MSEGTTHVLRCLQDNRASLDDTCRSALFDMVIKVALLSLKCRLKSQDMIKLPVGTSEIYGDVARCLSVHWAGIGKLKRELGGAGGSNCRRYRLYNTYEKSLQSRDTTILQCDETRYATI